MRTSIAILCILIFTLTASGAASGPLVHGVSGVMPYRFSRTARRQAASQATVTQIAGGPAAETGDQAKSVLLKVFLVSARIHDLLSVSDTSNWKMTDTERSQFQQEVNLVETQLQTLEKSRYQFYYHPEDYEAGGETLDGLGKLIPAVRKVAEGVAQFGGAAAAEPFKQPVDELSGLRESLRSYLETQFPGKFPQAETPASPASVAVESHKAAPPPSVGAAAPASASNVAQQVAKANQATQAAPPVAAAPAVIPELQPDQVKALLTHLYLADARVSDLLSLLQPDKWKMSDAERGLFNDRLRTVQDQLKTVEKWRYQFSYNLNEMDLGEKTVSALGDLIPGILGIETMVSQYESLAAGTQLVQAAGQLAASRNSLGSYVAFLQAQKKQMTASSTGLPGGEGLETERINVPQAAPPLSSLAVATPPLTPGQVKSILYKVYISEFRIRDLLGQDHPAQWKTASPPERTLAGQARAELLTRLGALEKQRALFSQHPGNMLYAFQTYRAVDALFHPLRVFGREAGKYENGNLAAAYGRRENDMEAQMNGLIPYISFILQHADRNLETFQTDLASCQNQLGYAMHSLIHAPQPMKNIVPAFQGRRVSRAKRKNKSSQTAKGSKEPDPKQRKR